MGRTLGFLEVLVGKEGDSRAAIYAQHIKFMPMGFPLDYVFNPYVQNLTLPFANLYVSTLKRLAPLPAFQSIGEVFEMEKVDLDVQDRGEEPGRMCEIEKDSDYMRLPQDWVGRESTPVEEESSSAGLCTHTLRMLRLHGNPIGKIHGGAATMASCYAARKSLEAITRARQISLGKGATSSSSSELHVAPSQWKEKLITINLLSSVPCTGKETVSLTTRVIDARGNEEREKDSSVGEECKASSGESDWRDSNWRTSTRMRSKKGHLLTHCSVSWAPMREHK